MRRGVGTRDGCVFVLRVCMLCGERLSMVCTPCIRAASHPRLRPQLSAPCPSCAARERIIGWYHTGPRLRESDLDIHALFASYCDNPVLVITEVQVRGSVLDLRMSLLASRCSR